MAMALVGNEPGPQCDCVNTYTGIALAKAVETTEGEAETEALREAKIAAQAGFDIARDRACPGTCPQDSAGGDSEPTVEIVGKHEDASDPVNRKFVAYAVAKWKRRLECRGTATRVQWSRATEFKVERHSVADAGAPDCGKTRIYSGCVIACASNSTVDEAQIDARKAARDEAVRLIALDRAHTCPNNCGPGQGEGGSNPTAVDVINEHVYQATRTKYIAHAYVYWQVAITCPP